MSGQKVYAARMMQIEKQREEYYKSLGTPPGVPTMKGATAYPDNTGYVYNTIIGELGEHSVAEGWVQRPKRNTTLVRHRNRSFNGTSPKNLTMRNRAMAISQRKRPTSKTSSSITATTSAAPLISPMPRPTSPSSMPTCLLANCSWTNTVARRCRTS